MRKITQAIGAGETVYLPMCMSFMLIETASYECSFYFYGKNNQLNKEIVGFKDIFTVNAGKNSFFMKVGVYSAQAQTIEVVILDDDRVIYNKMSGDITITGNELPNMGNYYDSLAGQRYYYHGRKAELAGNVSLLCLWNKPTSPTIVILEECCFFTEYTTIVSGKGFSSATLPGAHLSYGYNMEIGAASAQGEIGASHGTTAPHGSDILHFRWSATNYTNNNRNYNISNFRRPFIIRPGYGVAFTAQTKDCWLDVGFQWREVNI